MSTRFIRRRLRETRVRGRKGVALVMVLGIVALLLILVMAFAFDAQTTSQSASMMADASSARLMARGGLERATSVIVNELGASTNGANALNPGVNFYDPGTATPATVNNWRGRIYMPSASVGGASHDTGIIPALHVAFSSGSGNTVNYTSVTDTLVAQVSFDTVVVAKDLSGRVKNGSTSGNFSSNDLSLIGRVVYLIIDCTGFVDPSTVVNGTDDESKNAGHASLPVRTGAGMDELQIEDLLGVPGNAYERAFQLSTNAPGQLPAANPFWLSYPHIASATQPTQAEFDSVVSTLFPFSRVELEQYYRETGSDSVADVALNEIRDRQALDRMGIDFDTEAVYDALIGYHATLNPNRNTVAQYSPWLASTGVGASTDSARVYAARLALYMADRADSSTDSSVTYAIINSADGALSFGTLSGAIASASVGAGNRVVYGIEQGPYLSELEAQLVVNFVPGTSLTVQPLFRVECYDPWNDGSVTNLEVVITYDIDVSDDGGMSVVQNNQTVTITGLGGADFTVTNGVAGASTANSTGRLYHNAVGKGPVAFNGGAAVPSTVWTMNRFTIKSVVTRYTNPDGNFVTRAFPTHSDGPEGYWIQWIGTASSYVTGNTRFGHVSTTDPLFCEVDGRDTTKFDSLWTQRVGVLEADMAVVNAGAQAQIGAATGLGYANVAYGDIERPSRGPFTRIGQLGDLHSPVRPLQSLRLWEATPGDGHDGRILDMFYIQADQAGQRGRINVNTASFGVAYALFMGLVDANTIESIDSFNAQRMATALRLLNGTGSTNEPLTYRGDLAPIWGTLATLPTIGTTNIDDDLMEDFVERTVELTSTRYNHYVIVVDAQALKDLGQLPDAGAASIGAIKWKDGSPGNDSWFTQLAEQKIMAYVERDAYTNTIRILRVETVE